MSLYGTCVFRLEQCFGCRKAAFGESGKRVSLGTGGVSQPCAGQARGPAVEPVEAPHSVTMCTCLREANLVISARGVHAHARPSATEIQFVEAPSHN